MFERAHYCVISRSSRPAYTAHPRHVVRPASTAFEHQLGCIGLDQRRHLPPRHLEALLRALAEMVDTRRVTIRLTKTRHHRVQNLRNDGSSGVVIEIEMLHLHPF